jgi:hypothetical protein
MTTPSAPQPATITIGFATALPHGLRRSAESMSWDAFLAEYAPNTGPVRLGQWACTDPERPAGRLGPQPRHYQATLAIGDRIATSTAAASGPVAALTAMLHDHGVGVEIRAFHQVSCGGKVATVIHGCNGAHAAWAMGLDDEATQSALRAVVACANRLLAAG